MSEVCLYGVSEGIATITLNRPDALNALNGELSDALNKNLEQTRGDLGVRCVVITGAGRAFSSGADLQEARKRFEEMGGLAPSEILRNRYHRFVHAITEMEKPVIAAVNGVAAGAGASLALACDVRVAAEGARFIQAFIRIGLIPDSGANYLLPHLVGYAKALELALTGDQVDAETALRLGLVNEVVPADRLLDHVREKWAMPFADGPTRAYGLTKKAMLFGATHELGETLDYEADLQDQAALTQDAAEGIRSFLEKRPPRYEGR